jgi:hypothetical protein
MKTNYQDPGTSEIRSTQIAGMQESLGKIEDILDMQLEAEEGIELTELYISVEDRYRIYKAPAGKRNWAASPAPVVYKNDVEITEGFTIDYAGGAIIASPSAIETDVFTADASYTKTAGNKLETHMAESVTSAANKKMRVLAGVIKNSAGTWAYINDTGHEPINLSTISQDSSNIILGYGIVASKVGAFEVTVDETLAKYGLIVGASVGVSTASIRLYMPFSCLVDNTGAIAAIPNFFGNTVTIAPIGDLSGYIISHPETFNGDVPIVTLARVNTGNGSIEGQEVRIAYGATTITLVAYSPISGYISYNGSAWNVVTDNLDIPTCSFNGTTGELTVTFTHKPPTNYSIAVTSRDGAYIPVLGSVSQNYFVVKFKDWAGNTILAADTNMKLFYLSGEMARSKWGANNVTLIRRGYMQLNPANVVDADGNLWVYGIVQD